MGLRERLQKGPGKLLFQCGVIGLEREEVNQSVTAMRTRRNLRANFGWVVIVTMPKKNSLNQTGKARNVYPTATRSQNVLIGAGARVVFQACIFELLKAQ